MKKTLALLLVASLLLAGCTELTDAVDEAGEEILNIEVDEEIALEQIDDFLTVDESESFGITIMYEIDMSQMGDDSGMLDVDEDTLITMEMTEAWSPDGYHSSSVTGMDDGDMTISMITSMTHVGTTMYMSIGYDIDGELGADATEEEEAQFAMMQAMMTEVEYFSMTTTTTHTEVIAAMAEESQESSEDMDPMAFLEMIEMIEEYGTFTPADSVDGLQMFDVAIDPAAMMEDVAAEDVLEWCDVDDNGALSWSEFTSEDCDGDDDSEFETIFNDADTDMSGELTEDELPAFIEAAMALSEEIPTPEEALDMCDADASGGISFEEFKAEDCDDTDSEDEDVLESEFNYQDADGNGELSGDELSEFIGVVSTYYEQTDSDDDMEMDEMPAMQVAFTSTGDIEYFSMEMEGTEVMMYILTEDRVNALFTDLDAGEAVALPFSLSYDMYDDNWDDASGDDGDFYCNDGTTIPMDWVNDGMDDCSEGEDEMDMGGSDDEFMCEDGTTIPMDWVGDGDEDCANGEDETYNVDLIYTFDCSAVADFDTYNTAGFDNFDESAFDTTMCGEDAEGYMFEDTDSSLFSMPTDFVVEDCEDIGEGEIECYASQVEFVDQTDADGNTYTHVYVTPLDMTFTEETCPGMFDETDMLCTMEMGVISDYDDDTFAIMMSDGYEYECADGSYIVPYDYINDGEEDCDDGSDESTYNESTGEETSMFTCADGTTIPLSYVLDGGDDCAEGEDEMPYMEETEWVMYQFDDSTGYGLTMSIEETYSFDDWEEEEFVCNDGTTIPMDWVNDGMDDCAEGEDEMNMDDSDETVMYVTSETGFHFEGDLSDYKIELATCESDYDMETGEETTTCTTVMSVAIADAGEDSDIMFHDADSSGTLSVGDMIHIGEVAESWDEVRLYSISADAYSDENPMHDAPGFTGLVGMLALLGAAFIRRNE